MKLVIGTLLYRDNSLSYLPFFLNSLKTATDVLDFEFKILLGDNSGPDLGNQEFIKKQKIIEDSKINYYNFKSNLGFAKAYNKLIEEAFEMKAEYFLAINPDVLASKQSIFNLIKAIESENNLASLAPKILVWDFNNKKLSTKIDSCGLILKPGLIFKDLGQGEYDRNQYDKHNILGPSGAVALYRMSALEMIKERGQYFDEKFFMYKEDCDLAYRLYLKNLYSKIIPNSIFYHDRSVSGGTIMKRIKNRFKRSRRERTWSFQGQIYIYKKHFQSQSKLNKGLLILNMLKIYTFSLFFERFVFHKKALD